MVTHYVNSTADDPADTTTGYFNNGTLRQGFNNLSVNGGGYITFADTLGTSPSFSSTASIALASGLTYELDTNAGYNPVIADVLTGSGALRKGGGDGGGVALTGANTYTGATTVSSGTLTLAGNGRIGDSAITVNAGATLAVTGAAGSMSTTADLTLTGTSSYPALATLAGTGTFSRNYVNIGLDGYGALTQTGAALAVKQSLYVGINTGSGGTYTISGGVASIANFLDVGRFNSVGAVNQTGGDVTAGAVSLRTGSTGTATYILSGGTLSAQSLEVSSQPGRATFTQNGGAVSLVAGGIGYGTLYLGSGVGGGAYNLSAGSLTAVNSYIGSASSGANASSVFTQTGGTHTTGLLAITAGYTASERGEYMLGNGAGSGAVLAVGRIISGNNGYPGTSILHFNGGLLKATGPSTVFILRLTTADVQAGGARIDSNGFDITVPQVLTTGVSGGSDGGLTKLGAGTLTLSGANTYSGHTTVSAGTLNVSGSLVSAIDVGAGGTLTGGGATSTEVTVMAGGTFAPGSGTTPFTTLRLVMAGTFAETISSATVFNQVKVTPSTYAVSLSGALSLNYTGGASGFSVGTVLKIIDNAGSQAIAGTFSNAAEGAILGSGGHGFRVSYVGGDGNDVTLTELAGLYGTEANDYLVGTSGADNIYGLAGADVLIGGAGADTMYGGLGDDAYEVTETGDVVIENAGEGTDTVYSYLNDYTLPANVERLELEGSAGTGRGNALANTIIGTSGPNLLVGGAGADTLIGGSGNDAYEVADAGDLVMELANGGYDTVYSYLPDYTLPANVERLELAGERPDRAGQRARQLYDRHGRERHADRRRRRRHHVRRLRRRRLRGDRGRRPGVREHRPGLRHGLLLPERLHADLRGGAAGAGRFGADRPRQRVRQRHRRHARGQRADRRRRERHDDRRRRRRRLRGHRGGRRGGGEPRRGDRHRLQLPQQLHPAGERGAAGAGGLGGGRRGQRPEQHDHRHGRGQLPERRRGRRHADRRRRRPTSSTGWGRAPAAT